MSHIDMLFLPSFLLGVLVGISIVVVVLFYNAWATDRYVNSPKFWTDGNV